MNIIDALFVTLGLDAADFKKGVKDVNQAQKGLSEESQKTQKQLETQAKKAAEGMRKLRDEVLALTAAFLGTRALKSVYDQMTAADQKTGRLAVNLGMATKELSKFEMAARQLGGTKEDMDGVFSTLVKIQEEFKLKGQSGAMTGAIGSAFGRFGTAGGFAQFLGATQRGDVQAQRRALSDLFSHMTAGDRQSLGKEAGFSEEEVNLISQGARALDDAADANDKYALTQEQVNAAKRRGSLEGTALNRVESVWNKLLEEASPLIESVLTGLTNLLEFARDHMGVTTTLVVALGGALAVISAISFVGLIGGIAAVGTALAAAGTVAAPLLAIVAALGGAALLTSWIGGSGTGAAGGSSGGAGVPRGMRNNNPGNLNFAGQAGARLEGAGGRFAAFGSLPEGVAALGSQLQRYASRGNDTVRGIISKFAPPGENNTAAYIRTLSQRMGVSPDAHLNLKNEQVLRGLISGIANVEVGAGRLGAGSIDAGIAYGKQSGASSTHIQIDKVEIRTAATDGHGTGRDLYSGVVAAANANRGLQ